MSIDPAAEALLAFWFAPETAPFWFVRDTAFDAALAQRFAATADAAASGELDGWSRSPREALALVLALDQLPRNLHRGSARAFAQDAKVLQVASEAVERSFDVALGSTERHFLYLPFEHSENLADQERAVALIGALGDAEWTDYAHRHHAIIARFGRFPHRNAALGRVSTAEEISFLAGPNSSF